MGIEQVTGWFGGFGSINIGAIISSLMWIVPIILFLIYVAYFIYNRSIYKFKVRIFRTRESGKVKENNYKGGYIGRRNLSPFFRIKTGKWWWQYVDLIETPKPQYMDEEDRVYYKQIDVDSYIQLKREFSNPGKINMTPVESDVKYGAVLAIQRIKEALRTESTFMKLLPYMGMTLLFVFAVIAYYYITQACKG